MFYYLGQETFSSLWVKLSPV